MFSKQNLIDDIVTEAFGFDNTPTTVDMERELRQELYFLKKKPRIGANLRRIRNIEEQLKKYEGSTDPNMAVRPSWLGDDDIDKETRMSTDTIRYWHKMNRHDEEMARKSAELDEYDNMQKLHRDRFKFDVPDVYKKHTIKDLFPDD